MDENGKKTALTIEYNGVAANREDLSGQEKRTALCIIFSGIANELAAQGANVSLMNFSSDPPFIRAIVPEEKADSLIAAVAARSFTATKRELSRLEEIVCELQSSSKIGVKLNMDLLHLKEDSNLDEMNISVFIRGSLSVDSENHVLDKDGKPVAGVVIHSIGGNISTARASLNGLRNLLDAPGLGHIEGSAPLQPAVRNLPGISSPR
jgi:hypothetical protein